jgi:hypothetical protein
VADNQAYALRVNFPGLVYVTAESGIINIKESVVDNP